MATYEITYTEGMGSSYAHGLTPSQARYNKWLDLDGCFETFRDFLMCIESVRKVPAPYGAYGFIERQYGKRFLVGQRVVINDSGNSKEERGEVVYPLGGNGSYVSILLDGGKHVGLFHPGGVDVVD